MATGINGLLRVCLAGSAIGALIAVVSPARAQWAPPWGAAWPGEIERDLEAQGYVLTAPLMRRPGIYLADVSAGPGGYQRLIIDARSGQVLESFSASGRIRGPALAARDEDYGGAPPRIGPPLSGGSYGAPAAAGPYAKSPSGGSAGVHIPAAISPYGPGAAPVGARPKTKVASTEHKIPGAKAATVNPPLPPPAPREAAKTDEPGPSTSKPADESDQSRDHRPTEVDNAPPAVPPIATGSATEASDKSKVSIVPPALFE
jgi:hypothetical protein